MRKTAICLLILCFPGLACDFSLNSPSGGSEEILAEWSPYIGIHPFANHTRVQEPHLEQIIDMGNLRGIRVDADIRRASNISILLNSPAASNIEVLGIFPNEYLRNDGVLGWFAETVNAFPMINDWEIGNEVGLFIGMEPEEYMPIFKEIFYFARENFPEKNIIAQAPVGTGGGARTFGKLIDLGLKDMFNDGLTTVVIHFYSWRSTRLDEFKAEISRLPSNRRIWVTETNADAYNVDWEDQIKYVNSIYPRLRNSLGAERIYWYVLSECTSLALVQGLPDDCKLDTPRYSPLMNVLIRSRR